jgi:hypothetical protein
LLFTLGPYSYLSVFTGFRLAALHACELTVERATMNAIKGPAKNAQTGIGA